MRLMHTIANDGKQMLQMCLRCATVGSLTWDGLGASGMSILTARCRLRKRDTACSKA